MAELAREGGAYRGATLAPTEITDCFCNLEGEAEPVADRTSSRRKNSGRAGISTPMLLHLTPKQLLVARKPTLMDDLITRNKTALLQNKMERTRKNKRSDVDSDPEPLAVKRLRSNETLNKSNNKHRKPNEDRKVRVSTRRFMSSLRSGKKRSHIKEASLLDRKKKSFKTSGTRSNDSETDTPSSYSSPKPNGHPVEAATLKQVEKSEKNSASVPVVKNKPASDSKPSSSQTDSNEPPTKKIRKKRRKVDSMVWLKKTKQKPHPDSKSPLFTPSKIKSEPLSEPEDSGLGSEMRLDLAKTDDRLLQVDSIASKEEESLKSAETEIETKVLTTSAGNHVWTIETFQVSPFKEPQISETNGSLEKSPTSIKNINFNSKLLDPLSHNVEPTVSPESGLSAALPESSALFEIEDTSKSLTQLSTEDRVEEHQHIVESATVESDSNDVDSEVSLSPVEGDGDSQNTTTKETETNIQDSLDSLPELVTEKSINNENSSILAENEETIEQSDETNESVQSNEQNLACNDSEEAITVPSESISSNKISQFVESSFKMDLSGDINLMLDKREEQSIESKEVCGEIQSQEVRGEIESKEVIGEIDKVGDEIEEVSDEMEEFSNEIKEGSSDIKEVSNAINQASNEIEEISNESKEVIPELLQTDCVTDSGLIVTSNEVNNDTLEESQRNSILTQSSVDVGKLDLSSSETENVNSSQVVNSLNVVNVIDNSSSKQLSVTAEITENGEISNINDSVEMEILEKKEVKGEEGIECQAEKADWLKALGLQSLRPVAIPPQIETPAKEREDKPSKLTEPGYTGTLKAVIKLNKGAPRSIVFKNNEDAKPEYQISTEAAASGVPITHLADVSNTKKTKDIVSTDYDTVSNSSYVSGAPQSDSAESDEDKVHGKESNLIIPEKSSSFSIHPGRLCCDVCCYCFGKFGSLDTPCHIAQLKGEERQQKILQNEPYLTVDSCLCDACYRYVDRKANCPSSAAAKTAKRARPPAATLCCVTDCTQPATHSVKRKWLLKIKRSLANKFEIDTEKHTSVFNPLCSNHHYWVDYYMVCGICRKRLNRNHLYTLGPETDRLNLVLAEDGIPARLSDKLFLCKLCRYYANMRLKYSDPATIPLSSQPFYTNYRKKILASLDVPVSDSDEDKPKPKESKDEDVMSLSGLATLLSDQPDPNQPRIQVKFGNVNIGTLSNLNIGQGRQEERTSYDRNEPANLPLNAAFDFQGPSTSDGSWEKVTSTLQFDKKTKQLWQDLQRPYGNQSSFLRHLVMLEKYWRSGYLVLSNTVDPRAAKYFNSVQTRNKSFEGKSEIKDIKVETPPPTEPSPTPPPVQETILKVPDPAKRYSEDIHNSVKTSEPQKTSITRPFCPIIPTGEVEVLPVNPNARCVPREKPLSKGTVIIQRPVSSQPSNSQSPCKIMITNVQSLAKPKVDPVLLNRAKSLVRMVSPGVSRQRPPMPVSIQRLPSRMARPRQQFQYMQQTPYQTLQAQLQAPPSNHPLQSLQQVVLNRYPPPPLVKISQQVTAQQRIPTPKPQSTSMIMQQQTSQASVSVLQQQPSVSLIHQLQQPSVSLLQPQHSVSISQQPSHSINLLQQQQQQPMVTLMQQQPSVSLLQQQQPSLSVQLQPQQQSVSLLQQQANVTLMHNQIMNSQQTLKSGPPPPYSLRPLLPKLPPSLSISTTPQSTAPSLPPSVSLLPPSSSNGVVPSSTSGTTVSSNSLPLPPISTLTSISNQLLPPPPYSSSSSPSLHSSTVTMTTPSVSLIPAPSIGNLGPSVTVIPASLPSSITLPSSGITIEKQPHNFSSPPILPPEKPIISVFREPLPTDT